MNTMKTLTHLKNLSLTLTALVATIGLQAAGLISVNIGGNIDATRVLGDYGVPGLGTVAGNWNNIGFDFANLGWEDGTESTVLVETVFPWGTDINGNGVPRQYGSGTVGTPFNHGPNIYPTTPDVTLTFSNLRNNFPDGYYMIVYLTGFASSEPDGPYNEGYVTDGRTSFYWKNFGDLSIPVTPDVLVETTVSENPGSGNFTAAHYAVFGSKDFPKNADVYTLTFGSFSRAVSVGGVQIVSATYEGGSGTAMWAGYPVDELGWTDTTPWLGWINVSQGDYIWSINLGKYIYLPEEFVSEGGAWTYVPGN